VLNAVLQTLFNCGEEVLRNGTADNSFSKFETVAVDMFKFNPDVTELTAAA
jgi:predicted protein tyrosine phosphatase